MNRRLAFSICQSRDIYTYHCPCIPSLDRLGTKVLHIHGENENRRQKSFFKELEINYKANKVWEQNIFSAFLNERFYTKDCKHFLSRLSLPRGTWGTKGTCDKHTLQKVPILNPKFISGRIKSAQTFKNLRCNLSTQYNNT